MSTRVAIISIIVEKRESVKQINELISEAAPFIIGRMGIPYPQKNINIITIAIDAPQDIISTLSGRIGAIDGVSTKTAYSKVNGEEKC